ncbi:MAG: hypothetical protein WC108_07595 [Bacteroidales bacterium]|jgi:hypothetical protein
MNETDVSMTLKFLGSYPKLHNQKTGLLLSVRRIEINEKTPKALIDYDTTRSDGSKYELKNGRHIQLIFIGNLGIPFSTIRSEKSLEFYLDNINSVFKIKIEEK